MPGNTTFGDLVGKSLFSLTLGLNSEESKGGDGDGWKQALLSSVHQHHTARWGHGTI